VTKCGALSERTGDALSVSGERQSVLDVLDVMDVMDVFCDWKVSGPANLRA